MYQHKVKITTHGADQSLSHWDKHNNFRYHPNSLALWEACQHQSSLQPWKWIFSMESSGKLSWLRNRQLHLVQKLQNGKLLPELTYWPQSGTGFMHMLHKSFPHQTDSYLFWSSVANWKKWAFGFISAFHYVVRKHTVNVECNNCSVVCTGDAGPRGIHLSGAGWMFFLAYWMPFHVHHFVSSSLLAWVD